MYTREDLVADVIIEANNIKKFANPKEIEKLNFDHLQPSHRKNCIYGQMTGDCFNMRAATLIEKCTHRYFENGLIPVMSDQLVNMDRIAKNVNGTSVENFIHARSQEWDTHYSAIEAYILLQGANNKNLIEFIKGQGETLEL